MTNPWADVSAARLEARHLPVLASLRARADVRVHLLEGVAWVRWPAGRPEVARCLMPAPGVAFFAQRGGRWFPFGSRLPSATVPPTGDGQPLAAVLIPAEVESIEPEHVGGSAVELRIVRGGEPKVASALVCSLAALGAWADFATTGELEGLTAARSDDRVVLLGTKPPAIPGATRLWGTDVLVPVGFRAEPELPAAALREAIGVTAGELVVLTDGGADVIARSAFAPLTRAGVRLALRGE